MIPPLSVKFLYYQVDLESFEVGDYSPPSAYYIRELTRIAVMAIKPSVPNGMDIEVII